MAALYLNLSGYAQRESGGEHVQSRSLLNLDGLLGSVAAPEAMVAAAGEQAWAEIERSND
jgi:hypothetical protein